MRKLFILIPLVLFVIGCGGKEAVKPSADSLLATDAFTRIDEIRNAYQGKDTGKIIELVDTALAEEMLNSMKFEKAGLTFTEKMVRITDEFVIVNISWQGTWKTEKDRDIVNSGVANLVIQRSTSKLVKINGDNPFVLPSSANIP